MYVCMYVGFRYRQLEREITNDLDSAVQTFDVGRRLGVRQAKAQLRTRLRNEFALEKEIKIAENLRVARVSGSVYHCLAFNISVKTC